MGKSNEWEFQGQVLTWFNERIKASPGLELDQATQEPSKNNPKRNDLVVWKNRATETPFLTVEIKTPKTPISDLTFFNDADEKARRWGAPLFAIWNMQSFEVYRVPAIGSTTPQNQICCSIPNAKVHKVEDWLDAAVAATLKTDALQLFDAAWDNLFIAPSLSLPIDASVFVEKLSFKMALIISGIKPALSTKAKNPDVRKKLNEIAAQQGFIGFVPDIDVAIAGQYAYRLVGQVLFYFALARKQYLKPLDLPTSGDLLKQLRPFWNEVRKYDYEALFRESELDDLVPLPASVDVLVRSLIHELRHYDWNKLDDDVLGAVFERLIPRSEQILLGQFYTPNAVADVLVAFAVRNKTAAVLDPGCGSGTFLMRTYEYLRWQETGDHGKILEQLWGFDISAFATELAAINLFRQNMSAFDNYPRIFGGSYFDRSPGSSVEIPPPKAGGQSKIVIPLPMFDAVVGNPPYLRSQNQDDLNPAYKQSLYTAAGASGIKAASKTDLFAFFIYKSLQFMKPGSRLAFVISSSWLTNNFGKTLQQLFFGQLRVVAIIGSTAEAFFSNADINAVLLIVEKRKEPYSGGEKLRFITLKKKLSEVFPEGEYYWPGLQTFANDVEAAEQNTETDAYRIILVDAEQEKAALDNSGAVRNWSLYLRSPLSYHELFGSLT